MKMIEVFNLMAEGKIEEDTKLITDYNREPISYRYSELFRTFVDDDYKRLEDVFSIEEAFMNFEVTLIPPKNKQKYRIKLPHSEHCIFLCKEDGKVKLYPIEKVTPIIDIFIRAAEECGVTYKMQFTEQDFKEIEELKPYEQFKELVKDDENE